MQALMPTWQALYLQCKQKGSKLKIYWLIASRQKKKKRNSPLKKVQQNEIRKKLPKMNRKLWLAEALTVSTQVDQPRLQDWLDKPKKWALLIFKTSLMIFNSQDLNQLWLKKNNGISFRPKSRRMCTIQLYKTTRLTWAVWITWGTR